MKNILLLLFIILISGFTYLYLSKPNSLQNRFAKTKVFTLKNITDKSNAFPLTFGDKVYYLIETNLTYDVANWPALSSKEFGSGITATTQIYDNPDWGLFKWFNPQTQTYYILEPSGQKEISLKTSVYLTNLLNDKTENLPDSGTKIITRCSQTPFVLGTISAQSVLCKKTAYLVAENNRVVDESSTTNCYLPVSTDKYLAFEQTMMPASSDYNICADLQKLGVVDLGL